MESWQPRDLRYPIAGVADCDTASVIVSILTPPRPPVTICYKNRTITVPAKAAAKYRKNGATLGKCTKPKTHTRRHPRVTG